MRTKLQEADNGGQKCAGRNIQTETCNQHACPSKYLLTESNTESHFVIKTPLYKIAHSILKRNEPITS